MRAADNNRDAALSILARECIGMRCRRGIRRDAREIDLLLEVDPLDDLVGVPDLPMLGSVGRKQRHGELRKADEPPVTHEARGLGLRGNEFHGVFLFLHVRNWHFWSWTHAAIGAESAAPLSRSR